MAVLEAASSPGGGALHSMESQTRLEHRIAMVRARTTVQSRKAVRLDGENVGKDQAGSSRATARVSAGMALKAGRRTVRKGCGWDGRRRGKESVVTIASKAFGGGREPSRPRIASPRQPVQSEASQAGDQSFRNGNSRDDSSKRSLEVVGGESGSSNPGGPGNSATQVLQDQFNRFAAAVALGDRKMAEEVIREMGDADFSSASTLDFWDEETLESMEDLEISTQLLDDPLYQMGVQDNRSIVEEVVQTVRSRAQVTPLNTTQHAEDVSDLERQLEELYEEVGRMIEEGEEETARELIQANYESLLEQLDGGVLGIEQAALLDILAQLYMNMGDYVNAEVLLEKTKELLKHIPRSQPLLDRILEHVASMYSGIEKPEEAIHFYIQSLNIQTSLYGKRSPLIGTTMLGLAKAYADNDEGHRSIELYQEVLTLVEGSKGRDDESLVIPLTHLGHTLVEENRADEGEIVLRRAITVTERAYGSRDGRVGVAICALARAKTAQGQVDEAVQLYCQGLEIMKGCSRFPSNDPVVEVVRTDLAEMLNHLDRETEAQQLWEENLRVKEEMLGRNDIQLVPHLNNAATSYANSGMFDKCEPLVRRSLQLMTIHFGPRAPEITIPLEMLATALHHLGRGFEAESLAREAVSIREGHYGKYHPITGQAYNCLASVLHGLGKDDEAEVLLWKVLQIQEGVVGPDCPELILTLELLVMLLNQQGRVGELQPLVRRLQKLEAIFNESIVSGEEQ